MSTTAADRSGQSEPCGRLGPFTTIPTLNLRSRSRTGTASLHAYDDPQVDGHDYATGCALQGQCEKARAARLLVLPLLVLSAISCALQLWMWRKSKTVHRKDESAAVRMRVLRDDQT